MWKQVVYEMRSAIANKADLSPALDSRNWALSIVARWAGTVDHVTQISFYFLCLLYSQRLIVNSQVKVFLKMKVCYLNYGPQVIVKCLLFQLYIFFFCFTKSLSGKDRASRAVIAKCLIYQLPLWVFKWYALNHWLPLAQTLQLH